MSTTNRPNTIKISISLAALALSLFMSIGTALAQDTTQATASEVAATDRTTTTGQTGVPLTQRQLSEALGEYRYDIRRCIFNEEEAELPGQVSMTVQFVIEANGGVNDIVMQESNAGVTTVDDCVLGVLEQVQFPEPGNGRMLVRYPFLFVTGG